MTSATSPQMRPESSEKHTGMRQILSVGRVAGMIGVIVALLSLVTAGVEVARDGNDIKHVWHQRFHDTYITQQYKSNRPTCEKTGDPSYLLWKIRSDIANVSCMDDGIDLSAATLQYVGAIYLAAAQGYVFSPQYAVSVTVSQLGPNDCAGIGTNGKHNDASGYAFFICGDGHWHIIKYTESGSEGIPIALLESDTLSNEPISSTYTLIVVVEGGRFHFIVNSPTTGETHSVVDNDADYEVTEELELMVNQEQNLTTPLDATAEASAVLSAFVYQPIGSA
jgi:hypothetical protein